MIKYVLLDQELKPYKGSEQAAALDLRIDRDVVLYPGQVEKVGTGIKVELPENSALLILPRSSSKITLTNTVGLIDADYRGQIMANIRNTTTNEPVLLSKGDRFLQAVVVPILPANWILVQELMPTGRGDGGFGSTGSK